MGDHALCWVHAERLVHRLDSFTPWQAEAKERIRTRIWWFYANLRAYRERPTRQRRRELIRRFDRIFTTRTGFATLDRLLVPAAPPVPYLPGLVRQQAALTARGFAPVTFFRAD